MSFLRLMMDGYFVRSCLIGTRMKLLTSCSGVATAREMMEGSLRGIFITSLADVAGALLGASGRTGSRGGRKVRLIDLPIPIRSSDFIGRYNRLMSSSDFCIGRLCRFVLSSDFLIGRSCFLVLSSDFCIWRLCRPVLSKKSLYRYFIC